MTIPARYAYIDGPDVSQMLREAAHLLGTAEIPGVGRSNPVILKWAEEVERALGVRLHYADDDTAWCGLFAAVCAVRAGWGGQTPKQPLWARNWAAFGQKANIPSLGDILVFPRGSGGHVAFYVGEEPGWFHILGGNQRNRVSIMRKEKKGLLATRRPLWRIRQPDSVKPVWLTPQGGAVSRNEA